MVTAKIKNNKSGNIIFDIGGVLFQSVCKQPNSKIYIPLERGIQVLKKCHAMLDERGNKLHKLYVLSNWKTHNFENLSREHSTIFNLFDGVVISGKLNFEKPDRRIYEYLLEQFQLEPSTCIFIDDLFDNVQAAQHVGMKGIHCVDFDAVEQELIACGVL